MAYTLLPHQLVAVLAGAAMLAVAAAISLAAPRRVANRTLGLMLAAQAGGLLAGYGLQGMTDAPADAYAWGVVTWICYGTLIPLHLLFLSTLPTPLAAPLRSRPGRIALALWTVATPLLVLAMPQLFITGIVPGDPGLSWWKGTRGPLGVLTPLVHGALGLVGLLLALDAYRRAEPGLPRRRQAAAYAVAFGWRDANWFLFLIVLPSPSPESPLAALRLGYMGVSEILFTLLLGYAILRFQILDIDLRIKRGLRASTVGASFVAAFFVASESAALFAGERLGPYLGIAAAGALVFALAPIQRIAERLSDLAMPHVQNTPDYLTYRKMTVYRAAVEAAHEDGEVSVKERAVLRTLREQLGIAEADAAALEAELAHTPERMART